MPIKSRVIRLLAVGDSGVGKTAIFRRHVRNAFSADYSPTVGVDFHMQNNEFTYDSVTSYKVLIWDISGRERFRQIASNYVRSIMGIIVVYSVTNRDSFDHINDWMQWIQIQSTRCDTGNLPIIILGNKCEHTNQRAVSTEEGQAVANKYGVPFFEVSAATAAPTSSAIILQAIHNLSYCCINRVDIPLLPPPTSPKLKENLADCLPPSPSPPPTLPKSNESLPDQLPQPNESPSDSFDSLFQRIETHYSEFRKSPGIIQLRRVKQDIIEAEKKILVSAVAGLLQPRLAQLVENPTEAGLNSIVETLHIAQLQISACNCGGAIPISETKTKHVELSAAITAILASYLNR